MNKLPHWVGPLVVVVAGALLCASLLGPLSLLPLGWSDAFYLVVIGAHGVWGALCIGRQRRLTIGSAVARLNELLLAIMLFLFLFAYIYAANANLDYVQRFILTNGQLQLALDTSTERLLAFGRYGPLLLLDGGIYIILRVGRRLAGGRTPATGHELAAERTPAAGHRTRRGHTATIGRWALALVLLSGLLKMAALPSFLTLNGIGILGWICLVPLLLVLQRCTFVQGVLYGSLYGISTTLLTYYWLATYNLISLQVSVGLYSLFYALFFVVVGVIFGLLRRPLVGKHWGWAARALFFGLAWCSFEFARSSGFLGFPFGLIAHTQYGFVPFIQFASLTGVWGVGFVVVVVNALLAESTIPLLRIRPTLHAAPLYAALALVALPTLGGSIALLSDASANATPDQNTAVQSTPAREHSVRIALIQQNTDPRKHDYTQTFGTLRQLTDQALRQSPDLVVWAETAFVPNIRRWSTEDPQRFRNARLVQQLLEYQASTATYLLTGNDDYFLQTNAQGETERTDYNAAILFSDSGQRRATYHKIKLVPFIEYFPYRRQFPRIYDLLQTLDIFFWTPGSTYTLFEHPKVNFSTPICFEDIFPATVRRFVRSGAELIVNISNDYWSLTPVEAKQHFVAALFRTIENRRPMVRATVSGLTASVDRYGRLEHSLPYYEAGLLVVDTAIPPTPRTTFYTRTGDWFPIGAIGMLPLLAGVSICMRGKRPTATRRGGGAHPF